MTAENQAATLARLDFFTTAEIAPLVHTIRIYPTQRGSITTNRDSTTIIDHLFSLLHRFTQLRTLYSELTSFNDTSVRELHRLKYLQNLQIRECTLNMTEKIEKPLQVTTVEIHSSSTFTIRPEQQSTDLIPYAVWLSILDPAAMYRLRLSLGSTRLSNGFLRQLAAAKALPLTHLTMPYDMETALLHDLPLEATQHLNLLSIQVRCVDQRLLDMIATRMPRLKELMVLATNAGADVSFPADAFRLDVRHSFTSLQLDPFTYLICRTCFLLSKLKISQKESRVFFFISHSSQEKQG